MERTGHRSTDGVWSYKRTSSEQQEAVSDILSSCKRSCIELQPLPCPLAQSTSSASQIVPSTSDVNMVNMPTHISTARFTDPFYFSSYSNFTINFNNMELELELSIHPYHSCHNNVVLSHVCWLALFRKLLCLAPPISFAITCAHAVLSLQNL